MIEINRFAPNESFFAAANGFSGFKSLFPSVFNPDEYTKIFILKGGPGTGKSTLLKGIISYGCDEGYNCTAVYCSSDPHSLDGAIIEHEGKRIAVIDGTAPHTTDPKYPGAVEEIINLGDSFDVRGLEEKRAEILNLSRTKSEGYRDAYRALALAGKMWEYIHQSIAQSEVYSLADEVSQRIIQDAKSLSERGKIHTLYYGAFGRQGYCRLPLSKGNRRIINVTGDPFITNLVMTKIKDYVTDCTICATLSPSPLDSRITDRIYTPEFIFTSNEEAPAVIDLTELTVTDISEYAQLRAVYNSLLNSAKDYFDAASRAHFALEEHYKSCMCFDNNDRVYGRLIERMSVYFA